ncbi:transcription elongation factor A, 3, isoform CRA_a [Roridomyces roridus]|uniref:Transcription elongation factor A, 3, isoform CRA_a n=1 Tax=Roridomyces roridus TaxID=1738132 RepID=A0AAD7FWD1_9AGAR|nr:transcription elongation factor A, 3, isoform CRA_a [Roridomyces roridus]
MMSSEGTAIQDEDAQQQQQQGEPVTFVEPEEDGWAETEAFQCSKCMQRKCRYRQAQTRSADESMTTFMTCVNCGYRWKFS